MHVSLGAMRSALQLIVAARVLSVGSVARAGDAGPASAPALRQRTFLFTYAGAVGGLKAGQVARVWLPVAESGADQDVSIVAQVLPGAAVIGREGTWGNRVLCFESAARADGTVPFSVTYHVTRHESCEVPANGEDVAAYLRPDALVPVGGKPAELLEGKALPADPVELSRALYDVVDDRMEYRKDRPGWGRGDAVWACDSRFGNCTHGFSQFVYLAGAVEAVAGEV